MFLPETHVRLLPSCWAVNQKIALKDTKMLEIISGNITMRDTFHNTGAQ